MERPDFVSLARVAACWVVFSPIIIESHIDKKQGRFPIDLVVVDNNQDHKFLGIIKQKFRELRSRVHPGAPLVGKVKFRGSGPEELIQLADMVCGAVGDFLEGDPTYYQLSQPGT